MSDFKLNSVVYLLIPTSNHNLIPSFVIIVLVVYLLIPTSNHNVGGYHAITKVLYIF